MTDFWSWFNKSADSVSSRSTFIEDNKDNLKRLTDKLNEVDSTMKPFKAPCCVCGEVVDSYEFDPDRTYCGGSPRCIP